MPRSVKTAPAVLTDRVRSAFRRPEPTDGPSFPFDRGRRFGGDVVDDAVDSADLVDDAVRHRRERLVRKARPVGRHRVDGVDRTDRTRKIEGTVPLLRR